MYPVGRNETRSEAGGGMARKVQDTRLKKVLERGEGLREGPKWARVWELTSFYKYSLHMLDHSTATFCPPALVDGMNLANIL